MAPSSPPAKGNKIFPLPYLLALLRLGARLDTLRNRAVDVVIRNPVLIVRSSAGGLGAGEGRIRGSGGGGGGDVDLLDGLLGAGRTLGGREESLDPGLVDKVEGACEDGGKDEVEEDASNKVSSVFSFPLIRECRQREGEWEWEWGRTSEDQRS
jgi:hypothetical protein